MLRFGRIHEPGVHEMASVTGKILSKYAFWKRRMKPRIREFRFSLYMLRRNKVALAGLAIVAFFIFIGVFGSYIAPYSYRSINLEEKFKPPSATHLFGTDDLGRDIFSRVLYGAFFSLKAGIMALLMSAPIGCLLGAFAGYYSGKIGEIIMRIVDIFMAFPALLLAMAIAAALGPSLENATLAIGLVWWPYYVRLTYSQALSLRERMYVEAARSMGASDRYTVFRHVLPNSFAPIITKVTMDLGVVIGTIAGLSFLGFGAQPPLPEWGRMVSEGRIYILSAWWEVSFPGIMVFLVVLGFSLFGDALRDLLDPKTRRMMEVRRWKKTLS